MKTNVLYGVSFLILGAKKSGKMLESLSLIFVGFLAVTLSHFNFLFFLFLLSVGKNPYTAKKIDGYSLGE